MNCKKMKPTELTHEELLNLVQEMTIISFQRKQAVNIIMEPDDVAQEVITYLMDKSKRGKVGLEEIKQYPWKKFENTLWLEVMNCISYKLRKPKVQRFINNTESLDKVIRTNQDTQFTMGEVIEGYNPIEKLEEDLYVESVLEKFEDQIKDENVKIVLDIGNKKCLLTFTYRNLARVYFSLFEGKKLTSKDFNDVFIRVDTNHTLEDKQVKGILTEFRKYIKQNRILGGKYENIR